LFYQRLFESLAKHEVRYLLVGGLAVNLHGIPRMTMDVDVVIALDPENVDHFINAARELAMRPVLPIALADLADPNKRDEWVSRRNLIAFALREREPSAPTVDVLLAVDLAFDAAYKRRVVRDLDGVMISLAAVPDLIAMKRQSGRPQDENDIEQLGKLIHE
jgi:hypothetical protein